MGSFPYILLLLSWRISLVLLGSPFYRGSIYRVPLLHANDFTVMWAEIPPSQSIEVASMADKRPILGWRGCTMDPRRNFAWFSRPYKPSIKRPSPPLLILLLPCPTEMRISLNCRGRVLHLFVSSWPFAASSQVDSCDSMHSDGRDIPTT